MQYLRHLNGLDYPIKVPFLKYKLNKQHIADRSDPRYCMYFGVGFPAGNTINGKNLVISVPRTTIRIVIAC